MAEENTYSMEISWSNYFRDPFSPSEYGEKAFEDANIHDALPYILSDNARYNEDLADFLGIQEPNRVIGEDSDTSSWLDTEDWAISCKKGRFIIGQTVSCDGKGEIEDLGIKKEKNQIRQFEHRIKPSSAYEYLEGDIVATIPRESDGVMDYEEELRDELTENGSATREVCLKRYDKEGGDWREIFSIEEIFPSQGHAD